MDKEKSGLSIDTLVISAAAAVAAAVIVPMFWERGTLIATALTPVIVSVVSEALRRPAEAIKTTAPRVRRGKTERFDPLPPHERAEAPAARADDPFGLRTTRQPRVRHHWKLAVGTGLVAFVIAAVALTSSELVFGGPATRDDGRTTLFGGRSSSNDDDGKATPTATPTETETPEATQTTTPTPTATPTVTPEAPVPTATPFAEPTEAPDAAVPTATPPP